MSQSKLQSLLESTSNVGIGLTVSWIANMIILPLVFGIPVTAGQATCIALAFTVIAFVRNYFVRRLFNWLYTRRVHDT